MTKKKALGSDPLGWIKPTIQADKEPREEKDVLRTSEVLPSSALRKSKNLTVPKFQTYEVKLTIRLKDDQLEFLSRLEREIMKNRSGANRKERITKNSIIRAMIDAFANLSIDTNEIGDENELIRKLKKAISLRGK